MSFLEGKFKNKNGKVPSKNITKETKEISVPPPGDMECMEPFDNIENQTIERFYNNYLSSLGDLQYRFVILGVWTIDLKKRLKMLTNDKDNVKLHRFVIRGTSHIRPRPQNCRFGGGSLTSPLKKRGIKFKSGECNWIGETWMDEYNNGELPSMRQIS